MNAKLIAEGMIQHREYDEFTFVAQAYLALLKSQEKEKTIIDARDKSKDVAYMALAQVHLTLLAKQKGGLSNNLYHTVNEMMAQLGAKGEITTRSPLVDDVMNALHDIDGGIYQDKMVLVPVDALKTSLTPPHGQPWYAARDILHGAIRNMIGHNKEE